LKQHKLNFYAINTSLDSKTWKQGRSLYVARWSKSICWIFSCTHSKQMTLHPYNPLLMTNIIHFAFGTVSLVDYAENAHFTP